MGKIFDETLEKIEKISGYNKERASRMLDDMATAYISDDFEGLDKSYYAVKLVRKSLRSQGYTRAEIDDYLLEHSYISKTRMRKLRTQSIYMNDSPSIAPYIENIADRETKRLSTDIIIDVLKSEPKLLDALKRGISKQNIQKMFHVSQPTALKEFYEQHKDIIN